MMTGNDTDADAPSTGQGISPGLSRPGGISYLHIPAVNVRQAATFYQSVFGWDVHGPDTDRPSFSDATGHVAGAWVSDQQVSQPPASARSCR